MDEKLANSKLAKVIKLIKELPHGHQTKLIKEFEDLLDGYFEDHYDQAYDQACDSILENGCPRCEDYTNEELECQINFTDKIVSLGDVYKLKDFIEKEFSL